jgi:hypothetical protein
MVGDDRDRSHRLVPVRVAALGLVLVLGGCGSGSTRPSAAVTAATTSASASATLAGPMPWIDEPASPPPLPPVP